MSTNENEIQMDMDLPNTANDMVPENTINSQETQFKFQSPDREMKQKQIEFDSKSNVDTIQMNNKLGLPPKQPKRFYSENTQLSSQIPNDFSYFNEVIKKNKQMDEQSQMTQDSQATIQLNQNKYSSQQYWQLGDQTFTKDDIKGCFSDKQIFNQANIFTRKHVNDLFEDSDDEVQEEGLVTQIHKRNMQDVYDMTPKDKKFTFLWNEFFIKLEKNKIKEKIPIKRSDIYGYIQQFIEENIEELINLHPQFVIHLFTMQDNGILDTEQIARSLKYLKNYPIKYIQKQPSEF